MSILAEAQEHKATKQRAKRVTARDRAEVVYVACRGDRKLTMKRFMEELQLTQNSSNTYYYQFKAKFNVGEKFELPEGYVAPNLEEQAAPAAATEQTQLPGDADGYARGASQQAAEVSPEQAAAPTAEHQEPATA